MSRPFWLRDKTAIRELRDRVQELEAENADLRKLIDQRGRRIDELVDQRNEARAREEAREHELGERP